MLMLRRNRFEVGMCYMERVVRLGTGVLLVRVERGCEHEPEYVRGRGRILLLVFVG